MRPGLASLFSVWLAGLALLPGSSRAQERSPQLPKVEHPAELPSERPPSKGPPPERKSRGGLAKAAAAFRAAWLAHEPAKIVANSPQLVIQLPGADPSAALGPRQAAALLGNFLTKAHEVEVAIRAAREVEPGQGYVELHRRYRVNGTQDTRGQSLFLGYRRESAGWVLVELRAIEP